MSNTGTATNPLGSLGLTPDQVVAIQAYMDKVLAAERDALAKTVISDDSMTPENLLQVMRSIWNSSVTLHQRLDRAALETMKSGDYAAHATFSRMAHAFGDLHHILGVTLDEAEARQQRGEA